MKEKKMNNFEKFKINLKETFKRINKFIFDETDTYIIVYENANFKTKKLASLIFTFEDNEIFMYSFSNKLVKRKIEDIEDLKIYIRIIKEFIDTKTFDVSLVLNVFDLHTFLTDIKNEFNIEIEYIYIYKGINKDDIKKFQIEYFGDAKLEDVISFAIKYLKDKINVPLEIKF